MRPIDEIIVTLVQQSDPDAERTYWWMSNIDRNEAHRLNLHDKVTSVLNLLQSVDNISMDIVITIKQKS